MFFFDKKYNEFSQEISSLAWTNAFHNFNLKSHKTGAEVPFALDGVDQSDEGEILCWHYKAQSPFQILQNLTLTIWND